MFSACLQYLLGLKPASLVFTTYLPTKYPALTREGIGRYRGTIICEVDRFKGVMSIGQYTSSYSISRRGFSFSTYVRTKRTNKRKVIARYVHAFFVHLLLLLPYVTRGFSGPLSPVFYRKYAGRGWLGWVGWLVQGGSDRIYLSLSFIGPPSCS